MGYTEHSRVYNLHLGGAPSGGIAQTAMGPVRGVMGNRPARNQPRFDLFGHCAVRSGRSGQSGCGRTAPTAAPHWQRGSVNHAHRPVVTLVDMGIGR